MNPITDPVPADKSNTQTYDIISQRHVQYITNQDNVIKKLRLRISELETKDGIRLKSLNLEFMHQDTINYEKEQIEHFKTKSQLECTLDNLELAQTEITLLRKQIDAEKSVFSKSMEKMSHKTKKFFKKSCNYKSKLLDSNKQVEKKCEILNEKEIKVDKLSTEIRIIKNELDRERNDKLLKQQQEKFMSKVLCNN